jgi:hypothetical protein
MVLEDRDRIGPDADKVLAHWGVGGTVESKNTGGGRVSSRFSCEVYFLPDEIRTSLQVFDADMSGQWRPGRP